MSRILTLGYEPPAMAEGAVEARNYRTWQFVEPLLSDGHQVCLVVSHRTNQVVPAHPWSPSLSYHRLNLREWGWANRVRKLLDDFRPDGVLAVTFNSCLRATRVAMGRPVWMDIYGDKLAEVQVGEYTQNNRRGHRTQLQYLRTVLREGDVYSTCSTAQKHALVGQLGMVSRLSRHTLGYEFVHPVLPGAPATLDVHSEYPRLRGQLIQADAFIVLWCGGYNVWTDVETLFQGLTKAMSREPRLVFVSVGGSTTSARNAPYNRFLSQIETSPYRERFRMLGWQPVNQVPGYYRQADVGINLDAFHYETLLGTRTRLVEMMRYGLPVITSLGCELSSIIQQQGLGLTFSIGDIDAFCDCLVALATDSTARQDMARRAQGYASEQLSFAQTTRPFREWAQRPYHAPDRLGEDVRHDWRETEYFLRSVSREVLWRLWALERGD